MNAVGWGLWPELQNDAIVNVVVEALSAPQPGEAFLEVNDLIQPLDLDLNEPVEEDLGGIEDLLEAAGNLKVK